MSESYKAWWYLDGSNDVWPMEVVAEGLCIEELVIPVRYKKGVRVDERYVRGGSAEENEKLLALLRDEWGIEASWDGLRHFWYIGLTEEGVRKRDERDAENAKLREERDMYRDLVDCMVHPDVPDQLAAENEKLRKLHDALGCTWEELRG